MTRTHSALRFRPAGGGAGGGCLRGGAGRPGRGRGGRGPARLGSHPLPDARQGAREALRSAWSPRRISSAKPTPGAANRWSGRASCSARWPVRRAASARSVWSSRPRRCMSRPSRSAPRRWTARPTTAWVSCTTRCRAGRSALATRSAPKNCCRQALKINPKGIDPNFFYGEFLVEQKRPAEAVAYLEKAMQAPARPGRQIADAGRREEAKETPRQGARASGEVSAAAGAAVDVAVGSAVGLQAGARLRRTLKPLRSSRLAQCTRRPCSSAMRRTIDRPSPLPGSLSPGGR